jgi:hypothetical protein
MTDAETEIKSCEALFDHMSDISVIDSACCRVRVRVREKQKFKKIKKLKLKNMSL